MRIPEPKWHPKRQSLEQLLQNALVMGLHLKDKKGMTVRELSNFIKKEKDVVLTDSEILEEVLRSQHLCKREDKVITAKWATFGIN